MLGMFEGVSISNELELYLVTNNLKPAAFVELSPLYLPSYRNKINNNTCIKLNGEDISNLKKNLNDSGLEYKIRKKFFFRIPKQNKIIEYEHVPFGVASNKESLERLINAKSTEEIGLALGYPVEASRAYKTIINGEKINHTTFKVYLAKAQKAGFEIPTWLAYISFIPDKIDIVNENVSKSSKELGKKYQEFVRKNNPILAQIVEFFFQDESHPTNWKKKEDGSYELIYV